MSISGQNLSIVIVTLKSEKIIHKCIESIGQDVPIIVVENSNNKNFKNELEKKYKNLKCVLSKSNIGMGAANNIGIKLTKTDYVLILNPDVTLFPNTLNEIYLASKNISNFTILAPISSDDMYPNYGKFNKREIDINNSFFKVDYVDGFAMLFNKKNFKDDIYFDERFFLYLENNDLCLKVRRRGEFIYVISQSKIKHDGAKTLDIKYNDQVELSRNWHWVWSKFYFNKKNFGILKALKETILIYLSAIIKFLYYSIRRDKHNKKKYFNRASGFYNAFLGKTSWYRPDLKD